MDQAPFGLVIVSSAFEHGGSSRCSAVIVRWRHASISSGVHGVNADGSVGASGSATSTPSLPQTHFWKSWWYDMTAPPVPWGRSHRASSESPKWNSSVTSPCRYRITGWRKAAHDGVLGSEGPMKLSVDSE